MYYYVYRITNIENKKHYYGARQSKSLPKNDLGVIYFSSSKDIQFKDEQKQYKEKFKYKIIKTFNNRLDMINYEIMLHNKFNVGKNVNFYNGAKQTSKSWDASGKTCVKDQYNNTYFVETNHPKILNGDYVGVMKNTKRNYFKPMSEETKQKLSKTRIERISNGSIKKLFGESNGWFGKKHSIETREKISAIHKNVPRTDKFKKEMSKRVSGANNPVAKIVHIYNEKNVLIYECHGNFKQMCKHHNLPYAPLYRSYQNNTKLFQNKASIAQAINSGSIVYKDWYAIVILA